jgi:hypothetical protein
VVGSVFWVEAAEEVAMLVSQRKLEAKRKLEVLRSGTYRAESKGSAILDKE